MEVIFSIVTFLFGVLITWLVFRAQTRQSQTTEASITQAVLKEGAATRASVDFIKEQLSRVMEHISIGPEEKKQIMEVLSVAQFREIAQVIDPESKLTGGTVDEVRELTKRLLFHVITEIFHFPFRHYCRFIEWLRTNGYKIPSRYVFESEELYENALTKVEKLNRAGIHRDEVDVNQLFSKKRPFVTKK